MSKSKMIGVTAATLVAGLLLGSVPTFVFAQFLSVTYPNQGEIDIRGDWGPSIDLDCSSGKRLIIADGSISAVGGVDQKSATLGFDVELFLVPQAKGPVLILHPWHEPPQILMLVHTDLSEGRLRFVAAEWSQSTKAAYGDNMKSLMPLSDFLGNLQAGAPYHRCP